MMQLPRIIFTESQTKKRQAILASDCRMIMESDDPKKGGALVYWVGAQSYYTAESFDELLAINDIGKDPHVMCRRAYDELQKRYEELLHAMDKEIRDRAAEVRVGGSLGLDDFDDDYDDELEATVISPKKEGGA